MPRASFERFRVLLHRRWSVPLLAELDRDAGCKFVTLARRLEVSRDSLARTLEALIEHGWIARNPGHGHPMRPEYILTAGGARLAPWCRRAVDVLRRLGLEEVGLRKWSLPVAYLIQSGRRRFSELKAGAPGLTARALTLALKDLSAAGIVERLVTHDYPPATHYRLTPRGRRLHGLLDAFRS